MPATSCPSSPRASSATSNPEPYLCEVIKVLPYWPRDRYLGLAPKYWRTIRARLDPREIERELGHITVAPPLPPPSKEQPPPD